MGLGLGLEGWSLIGRLKRAVKKIRFLLNLDLNRWKIASMIGGGPSSSHVKRRVSFNDRAAGHGGLRGFMEDSDSDSDSRRRLRRTISSPYYCENDNIDKRADMFIANFYKQLQIERQISLELRYANNVFASPSP